MELKNKILEQTLQIFNQKGLKFTMDDIAKEMGISKKTIYTVFHDKEELFLAAVDYMFDSIKEGEQAVLDDDSLPTVEKIRAVLGVMPEGYKDVDFRQLYVLKDKYPKIYAKVEERLENGWEKTIALIERGMEEGVIRKVSVPIVKLMMEASLEQFFNSLGITFSNIHYTKENYFEYEGLFRIHTLAGENKYDFLCYFHTKGMSYKKKGLFNRSPREIVLTYLNFHNYKHTVKIFDSNKEIGKAGPFPCLNENTKVSDQWSWFNFFWARSDYVRNLEAPQKTTDRYYYESWISRASKTPSLCYSLYTQKIEGFTGSKASATLKNLSKMYKYTFPISLIYIKLMYFFNK